MTIGFISDIHEDILSLQKALDILSREIVDSIICLGDIVGFALPFYKNINTRDANKCLELVKSNCSHIVSGNHDLYALRKVPEFKSGFNYGSDWYSMDYEKRAKRARNKIWLYEDSEIPSLLNDESKDFLNNLDESKVVQFGNVKIFISHSCFPDFSGSSIFSPKQPFHLAKHFEFTQNLNCKVSFSGHGHPEGCVVTTEEKISLLDFGEHKLNDDLCWIVSPCTANTSRKNGVLIFDTNNFAIKTIQLNNDQ